MKTRFILVSPWLLQLGSPVVPFCPFYLGVSLSKPIFSEKRGTLTNKGLLGVLRAFPGPKFGRPEAESHGLTRTKGENCWFPGL